MRFLITGHTGFKGSWFSLLLSRIGHSVSGLSLMAESGSLFEKMENSSIFSHSLIGDIRSQSEVSDAIEVTKPDIIIHFAAQSLVRESYRDPLFTYETNVMGSHNLLSSVGKMKDPPRLLMITTDKVYKNDGRIKGYVEEDDLGGKDPYSSSKAIADLLIQTWHSKMPQVSLGIARAGNVVGGGDSSKERLLPDLITAMKSGQGINLRSPNAVRPWQHVLDCLAGYLTLVDHMVAKGGYIGAWNIGPESSQVRSVIEVARKVSERWGSSLTWNQVSNEGLVEADFLMLDSTKARRELNWSDKLDFDRAVEWTVDWQLRVDSGQSVLKAMEQDIDSFLALD